LGSVGGGGRYDGLVGRFRGEDVPATGFSVGVSRLAAALKAHRQARRRGRDRPRRRHRHGPRATAEYGKMVAELRNAGIAAEMYLGSSGMKAQLKYADRRNAPCVIIQGSQEAENGVVQIKDLVAGKAGAAATADNQAWREERPGQFEVPAADIVPAVRALLGRQRQG
jgi:histidyl-tRNA synthetase